MKCKVCGYEINDGKTYCPMCGTKVTDTIRISAEPEKMDWNTKDFPKPRKVQDIEMNWGNMNSFMKSDGSEGFASVSSPKYEAPKYEPCSCEAPECEQPKSEAPKYQPPKYEEPKYEAPKYQPPKYGNPKYEVPKFETPEYEQPKHNSHLSFAEELHPNPEPFGKWQMPPEKKEPPLWYEQNFTATGVMKTGPAFPTKEALQAVMPDATIQYMKVDPPKPVYPGFRPEPPRYEPPKYEAPKYEPPRYEAPKYESVKYEAPKAEASKYDNAAPSYGIPKYEPPKYEAPKYETPKYEAPKYEPSKYDSLKNSYTPSYDSVPKDAEKKPEMFNTFIQKNEDFQKLLNEEYERIRAMRGTDSDFVPSERLTDTISKEKPLRAQEAGAFERSLFGQKAAPEEGSMEELLKNLPSSGEKPLAKPETEKVSEKISAEAPLAKPFDPEIKSVAPVFRDSPVTELKLEELISDPLDPKFDINTLEMTIRELKLADVKDDAQRSARRQKLAAMEAARDAYFKSLDESMAIVNANSQKNKRRDATPINIAAIEMMNSDEQRAAAKEAPVLEELITEPVAEAQLINTRPLTEDLRQAAVVSAQKAKAEEDIRAVQQMEEEISSSFDAAVSEQKEEPAQTKPSEDTTEIEYGDEEKQIHPELAGLYDDGEEDDDDEEEAKGHGFLRFLAVLLIIVAVLEIGILILKNFKPELALTQTAVQIESAVIAAVRSLIEFVKGLFSR